MTDGFDCVVLVARSRRVAEDAALVLTALEIPHHLAQAGSDWRVAVPSAHEHRARAALEEVAREPRERRRDAPERPLTVAGVHVAVLLALVFFWTGGRGAERVAFRAGEADARAILGGEWWRAVTALTLHGDGTHLVGNAVFAALFIGALGTAVGTGVAVWVTLIAGVAGNLMNAWFRAPVHHGVGASTAIFGAVGALSGVAFVARRRAPGVARAWIALGAGLALLAMLGSSVESDVGAHLFGFALGLPLGVGAARLPRLGAAPQLALSLTALGAVAWAWRAALRQ